jgi:hypothetical protein
MGDLLDQRLVGAAGRTVAGGGLGQRLHAGVGDPQRAAALRVVLAFQQAGG